MEDENQNQNPQLPFDPAALAKQVTDAAVTAATQVAEQRAAQAAAAKLQAAADVLVGRKADPSEAILNEFVADPMKFGKVISEATEERVLRRIQQQEMAKEQQRAAVMPFVEEYPELKTPTKAALIETLAEKYERQGKSRVDALKAACEDTVKDYGLKPQSEKRKEQAALYAGLPGGGGFTGGSPARNEQKSQSDFIASLRAQSAAVRTKK